MFIFGTTGGIISGTGAATSGRLGSAIIVLACADPLSEGAAWSGSSLPVPIRVFCCCAAAYAITCAALAGASPGAIERAGAIGGDFIKYASGSSSASRSWFIVGNR